MSAPSHRHDAFLSYSQRDHSTVAWLRGILGGYWVPGKRRRTIFLDRKSMGAGALDEGLVTALRESRWLVVCCSTNARSSEWVDREVEEFLKTHHDCRVLVCAVGATDEIVFPRSIEALQHRRGTLRWPDLRGFPEAKPKREQTPATEEALSLLAEILGFPGLAWRALALHRLGRHTESAVTFDQAEVAGRTLTPQTRSWREWFDIATAAALADDWRRACRAAESPGNEAVRFSLRCHVLQLWAHRDQPQSRW